MRSAQSVKMLQSVAARWHCSKWDFFVVVFLSLITIVDMNGDISFVIVPQSQLGLLIGEKSKNLSSSVSF